VKHAIATAIVYEPGEDGGAPNPQENSSHGTVVIHPELEVVAGRGQLKAGIVWNNADLAAVILDQPLHLDFQPPVPSDSEVKVGDSVVMVGYGPIEIGGTETGWRRFGENNVTEILILETGNVVFGAGASPRPGHEAPAHARRGDSGGACVRKDDPKALVGIITMGAPPADGAEISYFTSIHPHEKWLSEVIQQADLAPDAGAIVPAAAKGP